MSLEAYDTDSDSNLLSVLNWNRFPIPIPSQWGSLVSGTIILVVMG